MANADHSCCPKTPVKAQTDKMVLAIGGKYSPPVALASIQAVPVSVQSVSSLLAPDKIATTPESPPGAALQLRI
jgi:hypothetical protein